MNTPLFLLILIPLLVIGLVAFIYVNSDLPAYFNRPKKIEPIEDRHKEFFNLK